MYDLGADGAARLELAIALADAERRDKL